MKRAVIYLGFNNPRVFKRGVENVVEVQARALPGTSRKYYLFFDSNSSASRWGDIVSIGVKAGPLRFLRLNFVVARLLRRLERSGFNAILHSHNYLMSLFLWRNTDVFSVHDGLWYQMKSVGRRNPIFRSIERAVYQRSKNLHCNSRFTFNHSQLPHASAPARIIYCSTPLERFKTTKLVNSADLKRHSSSLVFSVRSIEPRARIDLLIDIAMLAQGRALNVKFVIAGKGPQLEAYRGVIEGLGLRNIELLGFISDTDLAKYYRACDCVLIPCESGEGFGLPIIEGYLFGKPVVASNRCAIPEVISDPKYLSGNAPEEMLGILQSALAEESDGVRFAKHYEEHFSNSVILPQFSEFYDAVFRKYDEGSRGGKSATSEA